jgi:hypothetical protein
MQKNKRINGGIDLEKSFKNLDILNIMSSLNELMLCKLPVKTAWILSKNRKKIDSWFKSYVECENTFVQEFALKDEHGNIRYEENNQPKFAPNNKIEFNKKQAELLNCEEILNLQEICISDLEGIELKPSVLFNLEFMINDDTE